jgi:hypothetical protein
MKAITEQLTDRDFAEVREWVKGRYGAAEALRSAFEQRTGSPFPRDTMDRWLHADEDKRTQPLYGSGVIFLDVARRVMEEWGKGETQQLIAAAMARKGRRGRPRKAGKR